MKTYLRVALALGPRLVRNCFQRCELHIKSMDVLGIPRRIATTIGRGWVAQFAEQWTENPRVAGSIPAPATLLFS